MQKLLKFITNIKLLHSKLVLTHTHTPTQDIVIYTKYFFYRFFVYDNNTS